MADAPSGGGSAWGPFEIILVILFAIALISKLQGEDFKPLAVDDTPTTKKEIVKKPSTTKCGLSITHPQPLETVRDAVRLVGTTSGCTWDSNQDIILYAQVVDGRTLPLSVYTPVYADTFDESGNVYFSIMIELTDVPTTDTGYVLLLPATNAALGEKQSTSRIPIRFER